MPSKPSGPVHPLSALRAVVLYAQHLAAPLASSPAPTPDAIVHLVKALGYVQIDTINVVHRAHQVALWSRFGSYDLSALHDLVYTPGQRRLYEGWGHAASLIPLEHWRFHRWRVDRRISYNPGFQEWADRKGNRALVEQTLQRIRLEGALRVGDFRSEGPGRGAWYDWKPDKMALEALFAWGELMVSDRVNFQRIYDVRERVLPSWVDLSPVDPNEACRFCLEQAALALGVFDLRHLTLYAYMRATPFRAMIRSLVGEGVLVQVRGEATGGVRSWWLHRDTLPLLQRAADGALEAGRTTFLAPFDSLFWAWERDERMWGFKQLLECYKPASRRLYGYFSFPILHKDRLVGRFDPKLDRKTGVLQLNALHLEPGLALEEDLLAGVAAAMRDFLAWHGACELAITKSHPPAFGKKLLAAL